MLRELAHELRDALTPVRSALDLMRAREFDAELSRSVAPRIDRGLDAALAILDAFVGAEQWESGTALLNTEPTSLAQILRLTHDRLAAPLERRCAFEHDAPPLEVQADTTRSVQVITALIEHAVASSAADTSVLVRPAGAAARPAIEVAFAAQAHAGLGESSFDDYRARGGGSRMALRTARRIMQLQRGGLQLSCSGGRGTLIADFAPRALAAAGQSAAAATAASTAPAGAAGGAPTARAPGAMRLVIVDDSPEVRRAYREGLAAFGYQVSEAKNAEEALQASAQAMPDVALIDIHLPGMNGYQLAQRLKQRSRGAVRLVMLSGLTLDETVLDLSKRAGFDDCFDKAAGPRALHALLRTSF